MKLKQLLRNDDSAVSPVIGVILMVAITVILAAVIATFVLGLGEQVSDTTPNANFNVQTQDTVAANDEQEVIRFTHTSGPEIEEGTLDIVFDESDSEIGSDKFNVIGADSPTSAGDRIILEVDATDEDGETVVLEDGARVSLTWSSGGESATLRNVQIRGNIEVES